MNLARLHFKNASALVLSGAVSKLLVFLATIKIIKSISVQENGVFQLALTFGYVFSLIAEMGTRGYALRELARARSDPARAQSVFSGVFNLRLLMAGALSPLLFLLLLLAGYSREIIAAAAVFFIYALLDSLAMFLKFVLRAYDRMEFDAAFSMLGRGMLLALLWVFAGVEPLSLKSIGYAHVVSATVESVGLSLSLRSVTGLRLNLVLQWKQFKDILRRSFPFAATGIAGTLYLRTGTLALSKLGGTREIGFFNTAARISEAPAFLPQAIVSALTPYLSRMHADTALVGRYFAFVIRYLGFAAAFLCLLFLIETDWLILFLSKPEYLTAAPLFRLYGLWILLTFPQYAMADFLICLNEERLVMRRYFLVLAVNVVLNIAFIPLWGFMGAGLALVLSELISTAFYAVILHRRSIRISPAVYLQVGIFAAVCAGVLLSLHGWPVAVRLGAFTAAAGVIVALFAWRIDLPIILKLTRSGNEDRISSVKNPEEYL